MDKTAHTPGPWAISKTDPRLVKHPSGPVLAECGPVNAEEARANARLIAAAPELYFSLWRLIEWVELMGTRDDNYRLVDARAAIAKARGE